MEKIDQRPCNVRLPAWVANSIKEIAEREGNSKSSILRRLLVKGLSQEGYDQPNG